MSGHVRLIFTLHNHQPIGNFDHVFEQACEDSYAPFLDLLDEFREIPVVLHNSGSLLEWLVEHRPEYVSRLRECVARGQVELLGGPFFEPIMACIPRRDRIGQMKSYKRFLEQTFQTKIRGMWMPERVWEQSFASDIAEAGLEYTLLDDSHFRSAGLHDDELHGYYLTENDGRLLKVFAGSERLRYLIPFLDPQETINHCRGIAERFPNAILIFGDDGEKFGVWPGSKQLVYGQQWFRRFFQALRENRSWLQTTTMAEAVDHVSPLGRHYLPDASYREMTEWALPAQRQIDHRALRDGLRSHHGGQANQFLRAGFWRNFLVKYPEVNEMYTRMLDVSKRLEQLSTDGKAKDLGRLQNARTELYRAQCNCPYWHGAFGGLYLPHLRNAVYQHLIQADTLLEELSGKSGVWVQVEAEDYNCDARKELKLSSDRLVALLSPGKGGHLYELDLRTIRTNLLATLNRRFEAYHHVIRDRAHEANHSDQGGGVDPNGGVRFKQRGLEQKLHYDQWPRKSLVDHFLQPGLTFDAFAHGHGQVGDFAQGVYQSLIRRSATRVEARQWREGRLGPYTIQVAKTVSLSTQHSGSLEVLYELERLPAELPIHFAVEFNFAAMPGGASDRYFYNDRGRQLGLLDATLDLEPSHRLGLVDEWLGLDVALELSEPAQFWTTPIQTVSQSEGGFELVHQNVAVIPRWQFAAPADGKWSVRVLLSCDTSAAQAKQLAERTPIGMLAAVG